MPTIGALMLALEVSEPQAYLLPLGLALVGVGWNERRRKGGVSYWLTTLIGLMPIVIQKPSLGGVYYYSMALVIMGGLLLSTILTSVLLPVIVTVVEDTGALIGRAFGWVGSKFSRRREVTQPA